jgi:hypothetical protein
MFYLSEEKKKELKELVESEAYKKMGFRQKFKAQREIYIK